MRICLFILFVFTLHLGCTNKVKQKPNIIIITDDQGYGDIGFNNNSQILTSNLDLLASQSIRFNNFYVSPVCAPTRSSLLTGRYSLRTGVTDTYNGGAMMSTDELTLSEILREIITTQVFLGNGI